MLYKIIKEYIRRITRNYKIFLISILGMSIAVMASFHIYHFAFKEINVNAFHKNKKHIYRLVNKSPNSNKRYTSTFTPLGEVLKEKMPEVDDYIRVVPMLPLDLALNGVTNFKKASAVDPSFFELFDFNLIKGSISTFKETSHGVILSEKMAAELFKDEEPIGKSVKIAQYQDPTSFDFQIVGIMKDIPKNSTIQGDIFIKFNTMFDIRELKNKGNPWTMSVTDLYLYMPHLFDSKIFSETAVDVMLAAANVTRGKYPMQKKNKSIELQRLDEIYFNSSDIENEEIKGSLQFLKVIVLIGILTLLLATMNYIIMNLGLNLNRISEFKAKRYLGATKKVIYLQFLIESFMNVFICFGITLLTYPMLGEYISELLGFNYLFSFFDDITFLTYFLILIIAIGFITGSLEFIISYKSVFKSDGNTGTDSQRSWLTKKIMIGFQLFLFIGLMICILFVGKQVNFIQNVDIGYNQNNILSVFYDQFSQELKSELESKPYVKGITDGNRFFSTEIQLRNCTLLASNEELKTVVIQGDAEYINVHEIELLQGRNLNPSILPNIENYFDRKRPNRVSIVEVLVNEEFVRKANLKEPLGTLINGMTGKAEIVGVFKNTMNTPLYNPIQPIVLGYDFRSSKANIFQIKYEKGSYQKLYDFISNFLTSKGFDTTLVDYFISKYDYNEVYKKELQLQKLLNAFTFIVLIISLLGLVAISLFITETKTKEIGVRKVNGATTNEIMVMLNKDFIKWVGIAFLVACPVSYYAMSKWLESFAYKTDLSWWVFALAGGITLITALITVSWQTYRAATKNPVEALRDE